MNGGTIIPGDVFEILPLLDDESVQMCMTSPPYWGLRDYGAVNQIGLENTPNEYVDKLVKVFREVRRMLKRDGTLWLNLGDSYAGSWGNYGGQNRGKGSQREIVTGSQAPNPAYDGLDHWKPPTANKMAGIKPKDLVGVPWMVAFALRADGWYLRQDIIWAKPNPMPESVKDRCTKSHEYLFLLSRSANYYCDMDAIKEPAALSSISRWEQDVESQKGSDRVPGKTNGTMKAVGGPRLRKAGNKNHKYVTAYDDSSTEEHRYKAGLMKVAEKEWAVRNKRDVWTVTTRPYKGAHFATFPPKLVEPCILAGSRPGDTVLDPFGGSGTVAQVAKQYGREYLLIELNEDYCELAQRRIDGQVAAPIWTAPTFESIEAEA